MATVGTLSAVPAACYLAICYGIQLGTDPCFRSRANTLAKASTENRRDHATSLKRALQSARAGL
eukprot:7407238-Alexandrium_andersonii.AAC.1